MNHRTIYLVKSVVFKITACEVCFLLIFILELVSFFPHIKILQSSEIHFMKSGCNYSWSKLKKEKVEQVSTNVQSRFFFCNVISALHSISRIRNILYTETKRLISLCRSFVSFNPNESLNCVPFVKQHISLSSDADHLKNSH